MGGEDAVPVITARIGQRKGAGGYHLAVYVH